MSDYRFKYPELYQFFGGYFYQGWAADYRWDGTAPNSAAVVRHFKAVNPPASVNRVRLELENLLAENLTDEALQTALGDLGSSFHAPAENLTPRRWLAQILRILDESPTEARILRELR